MKELNPETLKSAVRKLRTMQPRTGLWDKISAELNDDDLRNAIGKLPVYSAPTATWDKIKGKLSRSSRKKQLLKLTMVAASILLLAAAIIYSINQFSQKLEGPIAEKHAVSVPLTTAQIAEYENKMVIEEQTLKDCLEQNQKSQDKATENAVSKLEELTATRDSLSLLLKAGNSRPGTSPRLSRLEERRKQMILDLHKQLCE